MARSGCDVLIVSLAVLVLVLAGRVWRLRRDAEELALQLNAQTEKLERVIQQNQET